MMVMRRMLLLLGALAAQWIAVSADNGVWDSEAAYVAPAVMNSVALLWDFQDGKNGWGQSTALEMGIELDAINGNLRGILLPSGRPNHGAAFVDSPELRVDVNPLERDTLVFRMRYYGQCDLAMISLERSTTDPTRERVAFHDPVEITFRPHTDTLSDEIYYLPIWKHVTGMIKRVRFHPCIKQPTASTTAPMSGQTFELDWMAFTKAPMVTRVRGCIDKYYQPNALDVAHMNCTETERHTNGFHRVAGFECAAMELPIAQTYNCVREGGERITISGKHFGASDAIITIDDVECLDIVHTVSEVELECTLPPVTAAWRANPTNPSIVRVYNGQLQKLVDDVPLLSYAAPVSARPIPTLSNVAAHAFDVNWIPPSDIWESMTVTGYQIQWKNCSDATFATENSVVVGNVTSTTLIGLANGTSYQVQVSALTEDQRQEVAWQQVDLYGRRPMLPNAVVGYASAMSLCITTLPQDFAFPRFNARLLTNQSALVSPQTAPTLGPTGEIGDQGHFGLYVNGDTNVQNCNASNTCCDGYATTTTGTSTTAACTYTCTVTESRVATYQNGATNHSVATNAPNALPYPAKVISSSPISSAETAPITNSCGPALRLTTSDSLLTGSAWYPRQMNVCEGFDTSFVFELANPSTVCRYMDDVHTNCRSRGGDGFAFVVQNEHEIALGSGGMELGYGGITNALAIEFDTWFNYEQLDVYENHISVHVGPRNSPVSGNHTFSLGSTTRIADLLDGSAHSIRITYTPNLDENILFAENFMGSTYAGYFFASGQWSSGVGMLSVYMDDMDSPALTVPLRLEDTIELFHGRAWVGFTAATGENAWQAQDIFSWSFHSLRQQVAQTPAIQI